MTLNLLSSPYSLITTMRFPGPRSNLKSLSPCKSDPQRCNYPSFDRVSTPISQTKTNSPPNPRGVPDIKNTRPNSEPTIRVKIHCKGTTLYCGWRRCLALSRGSYVQMIFRSREPMPIERSTRSQGRGRRVRFVPCPWCHGVCEAAAVVIHGKQQDGHPGEGDQHSIDERREFVSFATAEWVL